MFKLPLLQSQQAISNAAGLPTIAFQQWWQQVVKAIEAQEAAQDLTISRLKRVASHTNPTTIIHAIDDGTTATIVIDDHLRVYGDGTTLAVLGASFSGLTPDTVHAFYYDDLTLANPAPTIVDTMIVEQAQAVAADGRHFLGVITTPPAGSGQTRDGGGAYPVGSSIGGEV